MKLYYNPLETACKSQIGAFACRSHLTLNIFLTAGGEEDFSAEVCTLVLFRDGEEPKYYPMKRWRTVLRSLCGLTMSVSISIISRWGIGAFPAEDSERGPFL